MTSSIPAIILVLAAASGQMAAPARYRYADPKEFSAPPVVLERLTKQGCVIPQSGAEAPLENLISGHFITNRRVDYAALCSNRKWSNVLVINGADGTVIARLSRQPDADHIMPIEAPNGQHVLFVRQIDAVESSEQSFCLDGPDGCPCTGWDLDGIVDIYEKWSETHCWDGAWRTVTSGD